MSKELEPIYSLVGLSDAAALQFEIGVQRERLADLNGQLALERELAIEIHKARALAIGGSPALVMVFGVDSDERETGLDDHSMQSIVSSAFGSSYDDDPGSNRLVAAAVSWEKVLRRQSHPDLGGGTGVAQEVYSSLDGLRFDPSYSISRALLAAPRSRSSNLRELLDERYRLHIAIGGAKPLFANAVDAQQHASVEINGAEWRVRSQAALKTLELIAGDDNAWASFMQNIVRTQHWDLINMVNRVLPPILRLRERLEKGDPIGAEQIDISAIDAIFERVWSVLGPNNRSGLEYSPPYQNWLEILLPAMKMLDPGEKDGEKYSIFESPIRVIRV